MNIRIARRNDLVKINELSELCYPPGMGSSLHNIQMRYYRDQNCYIVATDREDHPIAYLNYLRISKYLYDRMLSVTNRHYYGDDLDTIYVDPKSDLILLHSIAIHPEHRDGDIVMFLGTEFDKVKRGKKCVAEVINEDGVKFVERHGFIRHKSLEKGYQVYRYPNKF